MYNSANQHPVFQEIEIDIVRSVLGMTEIGKMKLFSCQTSFSISNFSISCRIATDSIQRSVDGSPSSV